MSLALGFLSLITETNRALAKIVTLSINLIKTLEFLKHSFTVGIIRQNHDSCSKGLHLDNLLKISFSSTTNN